VESAETKKGFVCPPEFAKMAAGGQRKRNMTGEKTRRMVVKMGLEESEKWRLEDN